ncbi:MAG: PP2C family protein-serine/threonine phosphatase, partial [Acidobacteriota bacterium]
GQRDEATLAYIETIEPLADRLLSEDFPATRQTILAEVARVGGANERAGLLARQVLGVSVAIALAVGLLLFRFILAALRTAAAQERELERRTSELAIARSIQTSVLPHDLHLPGFDVGAVMMAAEEVGGDFYEFRRSRDGGAWIAVGDVTGHGLRSGLIMLMAQSMFSMLSDDGLEAPSPKRVLERLNRALFFNLRDRLREDKYMTLVIARVFPDGRLVYAGAHTDLLVYRHADDRVERVPLEGVWVGLVEDVSLGTVDREVRLAVGDVALFHTDGITEARDAEGRMFEVDRLAEHLRAASSQSAAALVERLAALARQWAPVPADDISLMAIKRS